MGNRYYFVVRAHQPNLLRLMRHIHRVYTWAHHRRCVGSALHDCPLLAARSPVAFGRSTWGMLRQQRLASSVVEKLQAGGDKRDCGTVDRHMIAAGDDP